MPEIFTIPGQPETKYEITNLDFERCVKEGLFGSTSCFYGSEGKKLKESKKFDSYSLDDNQYYIVLIETHCISIDGTLIYLNEINGLHYRPSFIFIDCILPGIILSNSYVQDWLFIRTYVNGMIKLESSSQVRDIRMKDNSRCGYIGVYKDCISSDIFIQEGCRINGIMISENGKCGNININTSSQCAHIGIYRGICGSIDIKDRSSGGNLRISNSGQVGNIRIGTYSQVGDINVSDNGKCEKISILNNSECKNIRVNGNAKIGHILVRHKSKFGCIDVIDNSRSKNILIAGNCEGGYIFVNNESESRNVSVYGNSRCGYISINDKSKGGNIDICMNSRSEYISVEKNSQIEDIKIENGSQTEFINFKNSCSAGFVDIIENSLVGRIGVYNNSQLDVLKIIGKSQCGEIEIDEGRMNKMEIRRNFCSILLRSATIAVMQITYCHLHQLSWEAGTKVELYIEGCVINHFKLYKTSLLKEAVISIINSKVHIVQLQELLIQGQLILRGIEISKMPFEWLPACLEHIEGKEPKEEDSELLKGIYIAKIELLCEQEDVYNAQLGNMIEDLILEGHVKPLFRIVNSSLGKTEITGSDLTGFHFEYRDSKLLEVFVSGSQLPKDKIDIYNETPNKSLLDRIYFDQKISIYNQLKKIFENQGDIVESTWYHSKAMANQERLLSLLYYDKRGRLFDKWWSEEAFDLLNFRLNKLSNNHGESWRRALCFSLYLLFSVYALYFISINSGKPFSRSGINDFIGSFFSFLDFTHKIDFMVEKEELNGWAKFLDFFGRVTVLYCTYQFVTAFRRHGKRG